MADLVTENHCAPLWLPAWRPRRILTGLYLLCLMVFAASIPLPHADGQLIGSDGIYYYAYLPTLLLQHNLDFDQAYDRLLPPAVVANMEHTATGHLPNPYAVGPALLWTPFFLAGHLAALLLRSAGISMAIDGMGRLYQAFTLAGSLTYGFAALLLIYRSCRRFFSLPVSTLAVSLIWFGTNVVYYMVAEPSMSHTCSLFAVALFIELWLCARSHRGRRWWLALGLAGGLVALVRLPDATYLALPVLDALTRSDYKLAHGWKWQLPSYALYGGAALLAFIPQMIVWQVLNGSPILSGYVAGNGPSFFWLAPKVGMVLFSSLHGLFSWHPLLLLATVGLVAFARRATRPALWLGLGLAMQIYVIAAWRSPGQGDAFGGRMFISSMPVFALGLAALIERIWTRHRSIVIASGGALVAWNGLFMLQYRLGYIPMNTPLTLYQFTTGKLWMLADLARRMLQVIRLR